MSFGNVLTAMVTPFDVNGKIDYAQTDILINYLLQNGTEGLVIAGTTGESPTLTAEEKISFFQHVVKNVNKRVPVIAGTGGNNTKASISLTKEAERCGVDAVMLVTPYYNKPDQRSLYEHFKTIAANTSLPVMLYNIPGRSIVNITTETTVALSKIDNIVSIKEASGDLDQVSQIIEQTDDDFTVYSGDDSLTLPILSVGGSGVISVASHVIGKEMQQMVQLFHEGKTQKAAELHRCLLPVMKGLFMAPSPSPVKAALRMKGIEVGGLRLPLVELSQQEKNELAAILERGWDITKAAD
ncbi:4-hydroxy-tetrahydrodipicolinate synthase [Virgibacillus pantothenticus]|uniref:4-hydroxy-tetrahydrodipicolinate synthase n=1 Tax=Virgibacillus pantothenticus TaxID=1473 RepID=A0A0L0QPR5_VIRPA|nr:MULTISPECIES: 4-hydroxy-tetrahydrodipicolinate synthase [Virgibacillus]API93939.1 4-hydroxy-tetrahydrodipicolinate synthase [Virgibacillus sp. 6R]KNE20223.1 dihydrodipicolinate synthase [Virgibacillus pantothenticus]MBS7427516.1 4-hydroxy-tetrahydrodipicolinate synthase [Virgibacillus sp. 19R1-5]MBU8565994.1 4-hydroxy-tetrahydrodipicolinate synthase [Virgibacillus pantothenticus]MBU8600971.1 4-hydroxy-tetrahydrodipicolinate synthase [Virgibacillus pantothenticus]